MSWPSPEALRTHGFQGSPEEPAADQSARHSSVVTTRCLQEVEDEEEEDDDDDDDDSDQAPIKIGSGTPPGVHPGKFSIPDRF